MKLLVDNNPGAFAVHVRCYACKGSFLLAEGFVDVEGPAFSAYYCSACARKDFPQQAILARVIRGAYDLQQFLED